MRKYLILITLIGVTGFCKTLYSPRFGDKIKILGPTSSGSTLYVGLTGRVESYYSSSLHCDGGISYQVINICSPKDHSDCAQDYFCSSSLEKIK